MKRLARKLGGSLLLVWGGGWATSAGAGQGFYLGLEGGANFAQRETFKIYDDRAGLLGGAAIDDGTTVAKDKFKTGWLGGFATGYGFSSGLRPEIELDYRADKFDKGESLQGFPTPSLQKSDSLHGKQYVESAMGNLWLDFFTSGSVHPYIGGGAGYAKFKIKDVGYGSTADLRTDHDDRFAWQAGAGIDFDLTRHIDLGLGYRYLRVNKAKFNLVRDDGSHVETRYHSHAGLLSLRYSFGGEEPPPTVSPPEPAPVEVVPIAAPPPPEPPPPPPPPACTAPEPGQAITLDGCKAGDTLVLRGVNFQFDKAALTTNAKTILDQVGDALKARTDIKVEIDGHTDSKGADAYNEKLSQRRADSVRQYLIGHGVDASRMTTKGYGESQPVADNDTDEGRELNRRVELKITEGGTGVTVAPPAGTDATPAPTEEVAAPAADAPAPEAPAADAPAP